MITDHFASAKIEQNDRTLTELKKKTTTLNISADNETTPGHDKTPKKERKKSSGDDSFSVLLKHRSVSPQS